MSAALPMPLTPPSPARPARPLPRRIDHPGPVAAARLQAVDTALTHATVLLQPGASLLQRLSEVLAAHGAGSAVATLQGGGFAPFVYVMPALSPTPDHAVYYSDRHAPAGAVQLESASVTAGQRAGAPWLHCHATWREADGQRHGGHVLPDESIVAAPIAASVWCLHGAGFAVVPDAETAFSLFEPVATGAGTVAETGIGAGTRTGAFALRVRPNEDLCTALEAACAARGVARAQVRAGVGSFVGAAFDDGRTVEPFVTETYIRDGRIAPGPDGRPEACIDVTVVDYLGGLSEGRLLRGANAVLVTFELVVEPLPA